MEFFKFFPAKFLEGASQLTVEQCGLYIRILCLIYERDGQLVDDDAIIARRLGMQVRPYRRLKIELITADKLRLVPGGYLTCPRVEKTMADARRQSELQSQRRNAGTQRQLEFRQSFGKVLGKLGQTPNGFSNDFNTPHRPLRTKNQDKTLTSSDSGPAPLDAAAQTPAPDRLFASPELVASIERRWKPNGHT